MKLDLMRMRKSNLYSCIMLISIIFLTSCGKTDLDKERESMLQGKWVTTGLSFSIVTDTVYFVFSADNKGYTEVGNMIDEFSWEIVRNTLKTYYKKAPDYPVGYDKYNSQGVYSVKEFELDKIKLEQHLYNGLYTSFTCVRIE
ncbi:MAG: hypothetical protein ABIJ97_14880 [Bacteroidota bacterium]